MIKYIYKVIISMVILVSATMTSCVPKFMDIDFISVVPADGFHIYDSVRNSYREKYIIEVFCTSGEIKAKPNYDDFIMGVVDSIKINNEFYEDWIEITHLGNYFFINFPEIESYPVPEKKLTLWISGINGDGTILDLIRHFDVLPSSDNQITASNDNLQPTDSISPE